MKKKLLRILPLVIIVGLVVAIPASTQIFRRSASANEESANLQLLVLVNRIELTSEQMEEIHDILAGVLEERETHEIRAAELEEQMIAFDGTAEDLDEILEAFRLESQELAEGTHERTADSIDLIKEILSLKQGEILAEAMPGLLGGEGNRSAAVGMRGAQGLQQRRILEQLEERFEGHAEAMEGLRDRVRGFLGQSDDEEDEGVTGLRGRMALQSGSRGQMIGGMMGRAGSSAQQAHPGRMVQQGSILRGSTGHRGSDVIEELVEVLALKLEAME